MIISSTPFRVSLFGGGTDYPAWFKKNGGSVISFAINKYCYISIRPLPSFFDYKYRFVYSKEERVNNFNKIEHPAIKGVLSFMKWDINKTFELHHDGDLPARSGLGSSSSFTVGLLNALYSYNNKRFEKKKIANQAIFIEQNLLKENVGCQDQIIASYGGLNKIIFQKNDFEVKPINLTKKNTKKFEESIVLVYSGISRIADSFAKEKINSIKLKNKYFYEISNLVDEAEKKLKNKKIDLKEIGILLNETWKLKRSISLNISNRTLDSIYNKGIKHGALGGKLLGAGGGGFIAFIIKKENKNNFIKKMKPLGCCSIKFDNHGSKIIYKNS